MALRRNPTAVWIVTRSGKRGKSYRLRWIDPRTGRWASEACGRDLAYARLRRDEVKRELRDGLAGKLPAVTVGELAGRLDTLMAGRSASTIKKTQDSLRLLERLCGSRVIGAVDRGFIMAFRSKRLEGGVAAATVNKDLREIRSALSYAVDAGLLRANPLLRWKGLMLREPEKQVRVVEEGEFAKLVKACKNPALRCLLVVAYRQGLRRNELVNLRWAAVDLERCILHVVNVPEAGELTKSRKNRSLPMHPGVREALTALWAEAPKRVDDGQVGPASPHVFTWPDGQPFKPDWITHWFNGLVKHARIGYCSIHDLRRSFSTICQRAGIDRNIVKDMGGWSSVGVVEKHYTGDVSAVYREAMARVARVQSA
jgi:integrase